MPSDDIASLVFYAVLLVAIGGAMLFELSGRGGRALRQMLVWVVIFAGVALGADWYMGATAPRQQVLNNGTRIEVPAGRDGHFHLDANLNGTDIDFIVDTGATYVSLSRRDAQAIGLDIDKLRFNGIAVTANGRVATAPVTIDRFAIGDTTDRQVSAVVIDSELQDSLLGMSYLRRFARISFENDMLVLER
jgi:aspartyl protease family protein